MTLSLIPGAAHVDQGRARRGLLLFFLFAFFANGALIAPLLAAGREIRIASALAAAAVWILALYDAMRHSGRTAAPTPGDAPKMPAEQRATRDA